MQNSGKIPLCNLVYHWIFHAWIFHPWVFHAVMGDWRKQWLPLPARELGLNFIQGRISYGIQVLEHRNPVCVFVPAGSLLRGRNRIRRWRQWQWRRRDGHDLRRRSERKRAELQYFRERRLEPAQLFWSGGGGSGRGDRALRILWRRDNQRATRQLLDECQQPKRIFHGERLGRRVAEFQLRGC